MAKGIFITGTDTDVGKTLVAAALYRAALRMNLPVAAIKAVQSGCGRLPDGSLAAPDAEFYTQAASGSSGGEVTAVYRFAPACSPHLAARLAGVDISLGRIARVVGACVASGRFAIVEGAGGVMVPLNGTETVLDLACALALPVLVVADNRLGAINHTLLTLRALADAGLDTAGVVLNNCSPVTEQNRFIRQDNHQAVATFGRVPMIAGLEHIPDWCPEQEEFWRRLDSRFAKIAEHLLPCQQDDGNDAHD